MTMTTAHEAYSSTVTSRSHLLVGLGITVATAVVVSVLGASAPATVICVGLLLATSLFVSTVRVVVGRGHVTLGQGPLAWPRRDIPFELVTRAEAEDLSTRQAFGSGVGWRWRTTRLTIRRGPTLVLTLGSGEVIRVSTRDPGQAVALIDSRRPATVHPSPRPPEAVMSQPVEDHRPWFGPKRVGYGLRPQTWQGWLVTLVPVVIIVVVAIALRH
jgi:hypothetical protein